MLINVNFTLDINPGEWEGLPNGAPAAGDVNDPDFVQRIAAEVGSHAESVICDLFADQGWIDAEPAPALH